MTRDQVLKKLNKAFQDFKFYEEGHYYEYKGKRVGISATRLIEEYANEFNQEEVAEKVALKENKTIQQVLDEWEYKNKFACEKGTTCHEYAQSLWSNKMYAQLLFDENKEYLEAVDKIKKQANTFHFDYEQQLEHVADEYIIGSSEYDIASAIDHLFMVSNDTTIKATIIKKLKPEHTLVNLSCGDVIIVDYKTNSYLTGHNKKAYSKPMKIPLNNLNDDSLHHYYIQLSMYKFIIEKYTTLKVEDMFIVYMSENIENYEIIEIPYLKNEVEKILENRRKENMKSVPVLLIGKSGSGKSASLRNFKKEEIAIANVLGKPLPFKSDLEAPKVDDYETILRAIEHTNKKVIVIDDANYLITNEFMSKSSVKGFDKYNEMGNNFFNLINGIKNIEGGKTVYLIMHEDTDDEGNVKPKTIGKLLDDKVNIQGMFTICIRSIYDSGKYLFRLKTNGQDCVKTPIGLFEEDQMENDLKLVDEKIREYYDLDKEGDK